MMQANPPPARAAKVHVEHKPARHRPQLPAAFRQPTDDQSPGPKMQTTAG